jgi:molybdate transport system substrate-binding protein
MSLKLKTTSKTKKMIMMMVIFIFILPLFYGCFAEEQKSITVFAGSASKPALEEAAGVFEEETGIEVILNFSGSGTMLSQMKISRSGDLYIPGSPDYMAMAEADGFVDPDSIAIVSYLVPAILVQRGNPGNIRTLNDLAKPGIEIGIGNPEAVCVGLYAYEILEYNNLIAEIKLNIVTHAESCSRTATLVALNSVDAIIGWRVFSEWHDTVDVVLLEEEQIPRLSYIPAAISTYARDKESAADFIDFLLSPAGQAVFKNHGYLATEEEAREFAPYARIGGEYTLPEDY